MSEIFSLKWKNHITVMNEFKYFLSAETMVDVTLACDGQRLKAHKIVLAACSPYFRSLFLENPCKHPIVILKDVKYAELKAIIEFMYHGEVKVAEENLAALMKTAETLSVRGLSQLRSENDQTDDAPQMSINDTESSHGVMYSIDLSKWTLTQKRTAGDLSDGETYEPEIKQEPFSNDMEVSAPYSTDSTVSVHIPSTNTFHYEEEQDRPIEENSAQEENFDSSMPNLQKQILTTESLPSQSSQSLSNTELHESHVEETSCPPVLSSNAEDPVPATHVLSDASESDNHQSLPPLDLLSENIQSKMELSSEKKVTKVPEKSIQTPQDLEKKEKQRRSLRKHKKERHQSKSLEPSSKSLPESTPSEALKNLTPFSQHAKTAAEVMELWTPNLNIESQYDGEAYLARFLPFGLTIQKEGAPAKRKREQETPEANNLDIKKIVTNDKLVINEKERKMLESVKEQIVKEKTCCKCPMLESKIDILLKENVSKEKETEELKNLNGALKEKYKNLKMKGKNLQNPSNNDAVSLEPTTLNSTELTALGPTLSINSYKLNCCRNSDFSKFTGDLLEVVFGPEILGTSVLKGIAGCKKLSVLNPDMVRDIQMYVATKFNVPSGQVRSAIRQKLNVCHKAYKKINENMFDIIE